MKKYIRAVALAIVLVATFAAVGLGQKGGGRLYSDPIGRLWMANNDASAGAPPADSYYLEFVNGVWQYVDSGGLVFKSPALSPTTPPDTNCPLALDSNGDLVSAPAGSADTYWLDLGTSPKGMKWPQAAATYEEGRVIGAGSGGAGLDLLRVPYMVAEVSAVDMNVGTKTNLFTPAASQEWIVDYYIMRAASTSLTTVEVSAGSNAGANDWHDNRRVTFLTTATKFLVIKPMIGTDTGGEVTTQSTPFGIICNTVQGAAATVTIEVYAHRIS